MIQVQYFCYSLDGHLIIVFKLSDSFYTVLSRVSVATSSTVAPGRFPLTKITV